MQQIKERVMLKQNDNAMQKAMGNNQPLFEEKLTNLEDLPNTLKQEVLYIRAGYPSNKKVTDFNTEDFDQIIENNESSSESESIYIIDKETANGKENTYILDMKSYVVFKIKQTKIGGQVYHSYDMASLGKSGGKEEQEEKIDLIEKEESEVTNVDGVYCYSPNMKGFNKNDTYIELYNETTNTFDEQIKLKDANLKTINSNKKWYNYGNQIWANVKTNSNGLEAWWVWIPRYAYKITENVTEANIIFIDLNNKPIDKEQFGDSLPEGYVVHKAFTPSGTDGNKNLKGIWMSKYEPSNNFDYTSTTTLCYAPDTTGFDNENTYIELYDASTNTFSEEVKLKDANLDTINNNKTWYDYQNKVWANVKTNANGLEAWWVWIPRYAYKITENITEANIIFVDLDDKPIDKAQFGDSLPEGYIVHPAFKPSGTDGSKNLKGIWMSKYEPSWVGN